MLRPVYAKTYTRRASYLPLAQEAGSYRSYTITNPNMKYSDEVQHFLDMLKLDNPIGPRMLKPSEQQLLRLHAKETGRQAKAMAKKSFVNTLRKTGLSSYHGNRGFDPNR